MPVFTIDTRSGLVMLMLKLYSYSKLELLSGAESNVTAQIFNGVADIPPVHVH